ncbi:EAL domain-containing protein [Spiroplasma endosymbiont of Glossina fuscipes fuscipes]|uniref:EAL domain-containing protein n=1 Tax=Spiroplasma endosymbiont of Glossina fuscipes fuscipes TaxID=2004463 RepID=UPI003CEFC348
MGNILNIIFVYLFFILIFALIFVFTWGLVRNYFARFIIYYQAVIGGVFAILVIIAQGLIPVFVPPKVGETNTMIVINIFLPIIVCWMIGVFISYLSTILYTIIIFTFLFGVLPHLPNNYFLSLTGTSNIIMISVLYGLSLIIIFISWYFKWTKWTSWSLLALASFITTLIIILTQSRIMAVSANLVNELYVLVWITMSYLAYSICGIIELIYIHALKLQNIIEYDRNSYVREALAHDAIYNVIHKNKIRHGIYFTFMINNVEKLDRFLNSNIKNKIIDLISNQVFTLWKDQNVLFFKASLNHFGIFVPLNQLEKINIGNILLHNKSKLRPEADLLKEFEILLRQVNTSFILKNYKIVVKLQGYASLYGLQSNNLDKLKEYNIATADNRLNIEYLNQVIFVDPGHIKELSNQKRSILALNEHTQLEKIVSLYSPIVNVNDDFKLVYHYSNNLVDGVDSDLIFTKNTSNFGGLVHETMLVRFNAALNIKNFRKLDNYLEQKLFIIYPASFIASEQFNLKKFATKLIELKIKPSNLILTFDLMETGFDPEQFKQNLMAIKNIGIEVAVKNFGGIDTELNSLYYYEPNYAIFAPTIIREMFIHLHYQNLIKEYIILAKKIDVILIAPQVNSYLGYSKLKELKIDYMFGSLFGTYDEPQFEVSREIKLALLKNKMKGAQNETKK